MRRLLLAVLAACVACGSDSDGAGGTSVVAGGPIRFTGTEAISTINRVVVLEGAIGFSAASGGFEATAMDIVVEADPGACDRVSAKTIQPSTTSVGIEVIHGTTDPLGPGTYRLGQPSGGDATPVASVSLATIDSSCAPAAPRGFATSGTVTITRIDANGAAGSVDVTLDDGTTLSGFFDAPACAAAAGVGYPSTFTCGP